MDVKGAKQIEAELGRLINPIDEAESVAKAAGFLDAIDQLKATGVKETLENACNDLGGPSMDYEPSIALRENRAMRTKVARELAMALAKLNALLGEKLTSD